MKITWIVITLSAFVDLRASAQLNTSGVSADANTLGSVKTSNETVIERGPHHRVVQRVATITDANGNVKFQTNSYTQIETGMHFLEKGEWREAREEIEIVGDHAVARNGAHRVIFNPNLASSEVVDLQTPDGKRLLSHILGLSYFDSATGQAVLIAEPKESIGQVLPPNQVYYLDAFDEVKADVRYTYTKAGMEQDIILREQPPAPEKFGLNPKTTRLQVLTEFLEAPTPSKQTVTEKSGLKDEQLNFGVMQMGRGKAFSVGAGSDPAAVANVTKQWTLLEGRRFLVEEVQLGDIDKEVSGLPKRQASLRLNGRTGQGQTVIVALGQRLAKRTASHTTRTMQVAKLDPNQKPGLVLDYAILSSATNFTFQGDTTYYVSGTVNLSGATTIEGGAVVKFTNTASAMITFNGDLNCQTKPYLMAIFTSKDDNSVGDGITGSTGTPVTSTVNTYLQNGGYQASSYKYLRLAYAGKGVLDASSASDLWHSQFLNCTTAIYNHNGDVVLRNILLAGCNTCVDTHDNIYGEHLTVDGCSRFAGHSYNDGYVTNSVFTASGGSVNQYYCLDSSSSNGVYQSIGGGNYYLAAGSTYRSAGTTNINADLLAALKNKTTYPPVVFSNVSVSVSTNLAPQAQRGGVTPDLGYHYDPIDYLTCWFTVSNATLTVDSGTAIACYHDTGIWIADGSSIVSIGTPLTPNWFTRHSMVQEQPVAFGGGPGAIINSYHYADLGPTGVFRFSRFSCPAGANDYHLYHIDFSGVERFAFDNLSVRDCEFWNGLNYLSGARTNAGPVTLNNNLFYRSRLWANSTASQQSLSLSNNLVFGVNLGFYGATSALWKLYDNAFDTCTFILSSHPVTNGNNAYINCGNRLNPTNSSDVVLTNFTYQAGPLGNYYQPTNSALINSGSVTNAAIAGLFHYTTTPNQVVEANSTLDIGLHYVSVDDKGNALDTDEDGSPDYDDSDSDGDGLPDSWELSYFGDLKQGADDDGDGDGLSNMSEYLHDTNPTAYDTDGDYLSDGEEVNLRGTDPRLTDTDGDGRTDWQEIYDGTDPLNPNSYATWSIVADQPYNAAPGQQGVGPHLVSWTVGGVSYIAVEGGDPTVLYSISGTPSIFTEPVVWTWLTQMKVGGQYIITDPNYATYFAHVDQGYEDYDGDGLANMVEASFGTNPSKVDNVDGDGIPDWRDDTDGDGLPDSYERIPGLSLNWNSVEAAPTLPNPLLTCPITP